jgi:hypothetical protein
MSAPTRVITPRLEAALTLTMLPPAHEYAVQLRAELLEAFEEARADAVR